MRYLGNDVVFGFFCLWLSFRGEVMFLILYCSYWWNFLVKVDVMFDRCSFQWCGEGFWVFVVVVSMVCGLLVIVKLCLLWTSCFEL